MLIYNYSASTVLLLATRWMFSIFLEYYFRNVLYKFCHAQYWVFCRCWLFLAGVALDKNGLMYFVDATMIRKVDQNGIISTLIKTNDLTAVRPLSCDSSMDVSQVIITFLNTLALLLKLLVHKRCFSLLK